MELAEINDRLEAQLKNSFGIELDRLPKHAQDLLEELVEFQVTTNLCTIDSNIIREWYICKRKESLDLRLKCLPVKSDIDSVKSMIASEEKLVQSYEKILGEQKSVINAVANEGKLNTVQNELVRVQHQLEKLLPANYQVNLKELAEKIQKLNKDSQN